MTDQKPDVIKKYQFIDKKFETIDGKENKDNLIKWLDLFYSVLFSHDLVNTICILKRGMRGKLKTFMFTFDKQFHVGSKDSFILEFFQDDHVVSSLKKLNQNGEWQPLSMICIFHN
jgi:hypothetical protein